MLLGLAAAATAAGAQRPASFAAAHDRATALAQNKQWGAAANAYGAFAAGRHDHELAPLASLFQGILLRHRLGQRPEAHAAFARAAAAPDTPFGRQLAHVARAWLARVQMEAIDTALRAYYVDQVQYPERLAELAARKLLAAKALLDPWGKPFVYKTGRLSFAPKIPRQAYTLTCSAIEGGSKALEGILKQVGALERTARLRSIVPTSPLKAIVTATRAPTRRLTLAEGARLGAATVAKITPDGLVLLDGEFAAFLRPATGGATR